MAIVSIKNSSLLNPNRGFSLQKGTGAVPVVPTPTFTSATTSSYTAAITGFDAQFTYTVSASVGSAVRTGGNVTVSGLTANQSSTLTVTAANSDPNRGISFTSSAAFFSLPATPTLTQATQTTTGGTVTITNYDASVTYTISITAGSASRTGNTITVTGLTRGQTATLSVTASNSSGSSATTNLVVSAEPLGEFESIATIVVPSGGLSSATFNNIPQTYQHLQVRILGRTTASGSEAAGGIDIRFNSDNGANYTLHALSGNGTSASALAYINYPWMRTGYLPGSSTSSTVFSSAIFDILDYTSTSKNKVIKGFGGSEINSAGNVQIWSGFWKNVNAVNTVSILDVGGSGNLAQYSVIALYGVKA